MLKNLVNRIADNFDREGFSVAPQKKLKTISKEFEAAFGLELVFYKGQKIAEGDLTLAGLNKKTSDSVDSNANEMTLKASSSVGQVEELFKSRFGTTVQIKSGGKLVDNKVSLGDARRATKE